MGESESVPTPSRKRKKQTETEDPEVPEKKEKTFCCRTFRQDLKGNEALKSLKKFISAAKSSDDVVFEYLENGGSLQEILSLIDATATGDLTTALPVFEVVHLILLRFQSPDSKYHQRCIESARTILRSHLFIIKSMLSMNVMKQKKAALKVLTAIATLDSSFANEIMNVVALSPTLITDFIQPSAEKESVRKSFILFVLSFLVEGNLTVVKSLLDKKGFLGSIIPGLKFDEASTVNLTLSLFEEKILKNIKIPKTLKLKLFNTQIIRSLFDLYDWKGPKSVQQLVPKKKNKVKEVEINQNEKEVVTESVHSFLLLLCCSQKYGVAFYDKSLGTSDQLNNHLLLTVFEGLPDPLKNKKMSEVMLKTIASCPDLMKPILLKLEPSFQPRNSKNWFQAMEFAENLIKEVNAAAAVKTETESMNQVIKVGKGLCAPVVFLRVARLGSQKSQPMEIRFSSLKLLTTIWGEIQKLLGAFKSDDLKKSLYKHVSKSLPNVEELVLLWQSLCDLGFFTGWNVPQKKKILFLLTVVESLHIIVECQRDTFGSPLTLTSDLLKRVEVIKDEMGEREFEEIQVQIVRFVELDLASLTPKMELFEKSLRVLLRSTDGSSLSYLSRILASLDVFARNKTEVDVWVFSYTCVPEEYRAFVGDSLIESIRLYLKEQADDLEMDCTGAETTETSPTTLISSCVEILNQHRLKSPEKVEETAAFRDYVNDVVIHLQHFYTVEVYLRDHFKFPNKLLGSSTFKYLKAWKNNAVQSEVSDVISRPLELELISWLVGDSRTQAVREMIEAEKAYLLSLYSLFRTAVAYLTLKIKAGDLSERDADRFAEGLSLFLCHGPEDEGECVGLISHDVKNGAVYQRHCLDCLFRNEHLIKAFDVFQKKDNSVRHATAIAFKVLMQGEIIRNSKLKRTLSESWKRAFLKQLKAKLRKSKSIDGLDKFERVLNFFEYDPEDVMEMVDLLMSVPDLDLFVTDEAPSTWTLVLSKFLKMHCQKEELDEAIVKKLCLVVKHLSQSCNSRLDDVIDCFVYLLRKHPSHILAIENEFLDVVLLSSGSTPVMTVLGKLLLNDPNKVEYFLKFTKENLNCFGKPHVLFSLLSCLILDEDSFLDSVKVEVGRSAWKVSEIGPSTTPDLLAVFEAVYEKFEKDIFREMTGEKSEIGRDGLGLTRVLIKLFLDTKKRSKVKKEVSKGKFDPELAFEAVRKLKDAAVTECFLQGLLSLFCRVIAKDTEEETIWPRYCSVVSAVIELDNETSWENAVGSSEWKEFAKLALGYCLSSVKHPSLMKILHLLFKTFYKTNSKDCCLFFQMLISHSQFLKVMLGHSRLKPELVELFRCLVERSPSEMSPKHFPILLASYTASLSASDQTVLQILELYEKSGIGVSDYEPFVWGDTAVSHYSIGTSPGLSLWQRFNMGNVLDLLDGQRLELSLKEFPIRRGLDGNLVAESNVYDPAFLLPLFVNLLSPGSVVFCLSFIYKGGLAYTVRALSSECTDVRLTASIVLTRFYNHLELSHNLKQKLVWMHFINCFRYGIEDLSEKALPNIVTLFFARMTLELSRQPAELYLPLQNFLLAKSYFSFDAVPEFLPLFHSSEVAYCKHREWLLQVIRDGTKSDSDVQIIFHTMAPKVIFCFFHSQLCDSETRKLILQVTEAMLRIDRSVLLISEYGLLNWITSIESGSFQTILPDLLNLLSTLTGVILKDIQYRGSKYSNSSNLIQVLNMAIRLLPSLKCLKSVDCFKTYLKIVNECFLFFIKERKSEWFKLNRRRLVDVVDAGVEILGEDFDFGKFSKVPFYFREFSEECNWEELKNCVFLFGTLAEPGGNRGQCK